MLPRARQPQTARGRGIHAVSLVVLAGALVIAAAGCSPGGTSGHPGQPTSPGTASPGPTASPVSARLKTLGRMYLAIAIPANHRLEDAVNGFARVERSNLRAAEADLRAEASTERWFDEHLARIPFPAGAEAIARALIEVNQGRITLTDRQARASSVPGLLSFIGRHRAADASVEFRVRLIRRVLGLPPPSES